MSLDVVIAVAIRPWLWATAVGVVFALAPQRWWKRRPFLPIPDDEVVGWRKVTAYGSSSADMTADDIVSFLQWRRMNKV